jgi:hypothetical protein
MPRAAIYLYPNYNQIVGIVTTASIQSERSLQNVFRLQAQRSPELQHLNFNELSNRWHYHKHIHPIRMLDTKCCLFAGPTEPRAATSKL